jgi:hypothetical protein
LSLNSELLWAFVIRKSDEIAAPVERCLHSEEVEVKQKTIKTRMNLETMNFKSLLLR